MLIQKRKSNQKEKLIYFKYKKDENGFDCVYGIEQLSKICIEHNEIDPNDTNFIIEASYTNPELL